jgi:hypothetical protein
MKKLAVLCSALGLVLTGCMNLKGVVKELGNDHAFDHLQVRSIWANVEFTRDGREANGNEITADGSVKSIAPPAVQLVYVTNTVTLTREVPARNAAAPGPRGRTNSVGHPVR